MYLDTVVKFIFDIVITWLSLQFLIYFKFSKSLTIWLIKEFEQSYQIT